MQYSNGNIPTWMVINLILLNGQFIPVKDPEHSLEPWNPYLQWTGLLMLNLGERIVSVSVSWYLTLVSVLFENLCIMQHYLAQLWNVLLPSPGTSHNLLTGVHLWESFWNRPSNLPSHSQAPWVLWIKCLCPDQFIMDVPSIAVRALIIDKSLKIYWLWVLRVFWSICKMFQWKATWCRDCCVCIHIWRGWSAILLHSSNFPEMNCLWILSVILLSTLPKNRPTLK